VTTVESQLVVLGQAVTLWNTPKATLLELALFRRFFASSLLTESYGESVASGVWQNEYDSNRYDILNHTEIWLTISLHLRLIRLLSATSIGKQLE